MPPNPRDDPSLTAAQERAVRDLLASARHDEPVPDDVAARLDASLAELTAVRRELRPQDRADVTPVVSLAARRRRLVLTGLVAAAATVVLGVGLGQVLPSGVVPTGGDATSTESGSDSASGDEAVPELGTTDSRRRDDLSPTNERGALADQAEVPPPRVDPDAFRRSVREIRDRRLQALSQNGSSAQKDSLSLRAGCDAELVGPGRRVLVDYAGTPAVLGFVRRDGDVQTVNLLACGSGELLRSTELRAR